MKIIRCLLLLTCFAAAPSLAFAVSPLSGGNSKDPIEINSDSLEVFQQENRAIFMGNVVAVQGQMRLKSDKMTVYYHKAAEGEKKQGQTGIEKIEVDGNVFLSTPEETGSGTKGLYDVDKKEIYLINNVVLTRGQNVLKGDRLTYNLESGKSVITGGATAAQGSTSGKPPRVRALFVPGSEKGKQ